MLQKLKNIGHFFNALLANLFYGFPSRKLTIIGVTGTDGKTTTATLIYHILKTAGKKTALISTVAAFVGRKEIDTGFHVTTPNPWSLQKLIKQIRDKNYHYLVLEVTSHGLDQHRLLGINFHIGVLTNITHEHLDYHKNFDTYLKTKAKLFKHSRHAVLNHDDSSFRPIKALVSAKAVVHTYSLRGADNKLAGCIKQRFKQTYNWSNALAAATTADILGLNFKSICSAIKSFPGVKGRLEKIPNKKGINVIVDFAHTPNALEQALKALRSTIKNQRSKLIAVYGSAGLRDKAKRPLMGQIGSQLADVVVLTAEDPRTEKVNDIIDQMAQGCLAAGAKEVFRQDQAFKAASLKLFMREPDRQKAINLAVAKLARKGDIVGIFGKGHEKTMCFGKIEYPWSDHEAVKKALQNRK